MIPFVSKKQSLDLDRLMVKKFKIPEIVMMDKAGMMLAEFTRQEYPKSKNVIICCGKGNNGGDGISSSRFLLNFGYNPTIFLVTDKIKNSPKLNLVIAKKLGVHVFSSLKKLEEEIIKSDLIIDCLIGYNLNDEPKGKFKKVIDTMNKSKKPIIACDIPSGIDADKGIINKTYIKSESILFLSLPKIGCKDKEVKSKKYVADIGVPKKLYPMIGLKEENYFEKNNIIRI